MKVQFAALHESGSGPLGNLFCSLLAHGFASLATRISLARKSLADDRTRKSWLISHQTSSAVLNQLILILRGFAFSAFGRTKVITPSLSSACMLPCSILLESWKLRA